MARPGAQLDGGRGRRAALIALCLLFAAVVLPLNLGLGANAEEVVGLLDRAPQRLYPAADAPPPSERDGAAGLRTSNQLPVFGTVDADGSYLPLMVDSHVGALSFYLARPLARLGGLTGARLHSTALAILAILLIYLVGARLGGARVAILAALLAATSSQLAVVYAFLRPDEQLDALATLAAILALIRHHESGRARWLYLGAGLFGVAVAAKNTALWTLFAALVASGCFRLLPRANWRQWLGGGAAFLAPLAPQLLYLLAREESAAMSARLSMVARPWESLSPQGLWFQVDHFADSVGHSGTLIGGHIAGQPDAGALIPGVGLLMFAGILVAIAAAFSRASTVGVRAFAAGLGILLLEYVTFYYRGLSLFLLLAPWLPIALAVAGVGLWSTARGLVKPGLRRTASVALVLVTLVVLVNNAVEVMRLHSAVAAPGASLFDRRAQEEVTAHLVDAGIERPYVTTYGAIGVFELLSRGELEPIHLFPYFAAVADGDEPDYDQAWRAILDRLGPGRHVFVLAPNPSTLDTSPCRRGELIASRLAPVAAASGILATTLAVFASRSGLPVFEIVEVVTPNERTALR